MPNSPQAGGIWYRCFYIPNIKLEFNFSEIFVTALRKAMTTAFVKLIDNCYV